MDGSARAVYGSAMIRSSSLIRSLALALPLLLAGAGETVAAECLSAGEARQAVASGRAIRLGDAAQAVRGEIIEARLCDAGGGRLVYRLAVMTGGGYVEWVVVDARSGRVAN